MIHFTTEKIEVLANSYQENFLNRMIMHLEETTPILYPSLEVSYSEINQRVWLRDLLGRIIEGGLCRERDAVIAIEYFVLFGVDANTLEVARILDDKIMNAQMKLEKLWALRGGVA